MRRGSLEEFIVSVLSLVPISSLSRSATKDIVLRLQSRDHEFLAGLTNGVFGYCPAEDHFRQMPHANESMS
jgi:hypothetical protein